MTPEQMTLLRDQHVPRPPELWQADAGDEILVPFWPQPVRVDAVTPGTGTDRFARVHWTAEDGASGVSWLTQHSQVYHVVRWSPDGRPEGPGGRIGPAGDAVPGALVDMVRAQRLAGIDRYRAGLDDLMHDACVDADMLALSRGEHRQEQPCGCWR
jgi:hypothetical protein